MTKIIEINGKKIEVEYMYSDEAAKRIRKAMKKITGISWSVLQGKGTSSYITITAPPIRKISHIENTEYDHSNTDYFYQQENDMYFDYSKLDENLKRDKSRNCWVSKEDGEILASIFGKNYHDSFLVAPGEYEYYVYLLENYEETEAERKEIEDAEEKAFIEWQAIRDAEYAKASQPENAIDITDDMIEVIEDNLTIIEIISPKFSKESWLSDFWNHCQNGDYTIEKGKVRWLINLTNEQYDKYIYDLMSHHDALNNKFDCITNENGERYCEIIKVKAQDRPVFYIETQGHDYARYACFPLNDVPDIIREKKYNPNLSITPSLITSIMERI